MDVFGGSVAKAAPAVAPSNLFNVMPTNAPPMPANIFVPQGELTCKASLMQERSYVGGLER